METKNNLVDVNCKACLSTYQKKKDSLRRWSGFCRKCSIKNKIENKNKDKFKVCKKCNISYPKTKENFLFNKKGFAYSYCRKCKTQWLSERRIPSSRKKLSDSELYEKRCLREKIKQINQWYKILYATAKSNSLKKNRDFDISEEFILELFEKQNGLCFWYGVPLIPSNETKHPQKPSLDRLNCNVGYIKENVVLSCMAANIGRSTCDAKVFEDFCKLLKYKS